MKRSIPYLLLIALVAAILAVPVTLSSAAPAPAPATQAVGPQKGPHIMRPRQWYEAQRQQARPGPLGPTDNLPPGSGPTMHTMQAFLIFWDPNNNISNTFKNLLTRYFQDAGGTPLYNIVTQYYDTVGGGKTFIQNVVTYGGSWADTANAYPHAGSASDPIFDSDIQAEVDRAISANSWPTGLSNMFFVYTEKGIESCTTTGKTSCTLNVTGSDPKQGYCAYHNFFNSGANERIYANMPYVATWTGNPGCNNTNGQPNNFDADLEVSTTSHEQFEAMTDPEPNSNWTDSNCAGNVVCGEIGDKCAYIWGTANSDGSNLSLHGNLYNVQEEWSNAAFNGTANSGCVEDYQPANVSITKTGPGTVTAGTSLVYNINVMNNGAPTAETPGFRDVLPPFLTFQALAMPAGWSCTTPAGTVTCNKSNGYLNNGETANFNITAMVPANTPNGTILNNTGRIDWDTKYTNPLSNSNGTLATVVTIADLSVAETTAGTAVAGKDLSYIIVAENDGPSDAQAVAISDPVPSGTTFVSLTGSGGWTCITPPVGGTGTVNCTKSTMTNHKLDALTLTIHVPANTASGTTINDSVTISSASTPDPNSSNNSASVPATVSTSGNVSISKAAPGVVMAGQNVTYSITVRNIGPSDAQNVAWSDSIPAGTNFASVSQSTGPAFACSGTSSVTCTSSSLAAGASATFTLAVQLSASASAGGPLCNTATVTSTTDDPDASNNTSEGCSTITTSADLAITQSGSIVGPPGHGTATFNMTIMNSGPSDSAYVPLATTVNLSDFPPSLTQAPITATADGGGTCTAVGQYINCNWAKLSIGTSVHVTLVAPWKSAVGQVCDAAWVSAGTADPNPSNNSSTVCLDKK